MSNHQAIVYKIKILPHPNPDVINLGIVYIDDYSCLVNKNQWVDGQLAAFIEPDTIVDTTIDQFNFLAKDAKADGTYRIRAKKLRGVNSFGLLVPAPEGAKEGDNLWDELKLVHYEPDPFAETKVGKAFKFGGEAAKPPLGLSLRKYDIENGRKYGSKLFQDGEPILAYEKVHGCQARYLYWQGELFCGSKNEWKKEFPSTEHLSFESLAPKVGEEKAKEILENIAKQKKDKSLWWKILEEYPHIVDFCQNNEGMVLCGEIYGQIQKGFPYDMPAGKIGFVGFDVYDAEKGAYLDAEDAINRMESYGIRPVPLLYAGPYNFEHITKMIEATKSPLSKEKHIMEGAVVRPVKERVHERYGRAVLKFVSAAYLEKN